ncbi:hypothetical protein [Corallococcus sp. CA047B]|nr:hypothetical protein [Corallococcus sp. CA047B]
MESVLAGHRWRAPKAHGAPSVGARSATVSQQQPLFKRSFKAHRE